MSKRYTPIHQDFTYHLRNLMIGKTTKDPNNLIEVEESSLEKVYKTN